MSLSNRLKHIEQEVSCGISGQAAFWYICISVQRREKEREGESAGGGDKERAGVRACGCESMSLSLNVPNAKSGCESRLYQQFERRAPPKTFIENQL